MSRKDGGKGMQLLGVLVLMGLGWVLFQGDTVLIGWVFVGALLLQMASTSGRWARRFGRRRDLSFPIFGRGRARHAAPTGGRAHPRGGYSTPSAGRSPRTWSRPGAGRPFTSSWR